MTVELRERGRRERVASRWDRVLYPAAVSAATLGGFAVVAGLVDLGDDRAEATRLLVVGAALAATGTLGLRSIPVPRGRSGPRVFALTLWAFMSNIVLSTAVYRVAGGTGSTRRALFESVSGFTTTSMSTLRPEDLSDGLLFWRASTQWLGGMTALILAVVLIPMVAGGRELQERGSSARAARELSPVLEAGMRRVVGVYLVFTALGVIAFAIASLGPLDAVTYAMTTASSGGFANHTTGLAHFDDPLVEWVAALGMIVAGTNLTVLWLALRGETRSLIESAELRVYLATIAVASAALTAWTWDDHGEAGRAIRRSVFTVSSVLSTTGHRLDDWSAWPEGSQVLLLALLGVGGMTGAAAGGFRLVRVMSSVGFAHRELRREVHPSLVDVVKIGGKSATESTLSRSNAFQFMFTITAGAGGFFVAAAAPELGLAEAMSASISALATGGPILGDLGGSANVADLPDSAQAWLMVLMVLGRLSIYPVLVAVLDGIERLARRVTG